MKRSIILGLSLALLLAVSPTHAVQQGGAGDDGSPPAGLTGGDTNKPGAYGGPVVLELRDVPLTRIGGNLVRSNRAARFLRAVARVDDGESFKLIHVDFVCGDAAVADPCTDRLPVCSIGRGNKVKCENPLVIDTANAPQIQAVVVSLLAPQIASEYGLDPGTVLELTRFKAYVQVDTAIPDIDGVFSFFSIADLAFSE